MYKIIEEDPLFDDIKSDESKNNLNKLVDYLCSMPVPEETVNELLLNGNYEEEHNYFAKGFYNEQNLKIVNEIIKNRTRFMDIDSTDINKLDGYSYIYELERDNILELGTMKYYNSVAIMEHELIHLLMALNNNNPKPQHTEILSLFGELLTLYKLSEKNNDPLIFENGLVKRCISRMTYRVYASHFSDEYLKEHSEWLYMAHRNGYPYIIGFIYAIRLLNIYQKNEKELLTNINEVLNGNINIENLLNKYNISLTDENTCSDFINMCDNYKNIIENRYIDSQSHSIKR